MKILFAHQNYPAQFGAFAAYLARAGWDVTFATAAEGARPLPGCKLLQMRPHRDPAEGVHRFAIGLEKAAINGQAFANAAIAAKREGYVPDIVMAHAAWGSGTYAKAVWPNVRYVPFVEWYYRYPHVDSLSPPLDEDAEDPRAMALSRNAPMLLDLVQADLAICPSQFQRAPFPSPFRDRIEVIPDGVDTTLHAPDPGATMPDAVGALPEGAEVVTYATRGMEPHRGFPEFCKALEILQKRRPNLYAVIGGEDRVAYGAQLPEGDSWKKRMLAELDLDESRIRWPGLLPRNDYVRMLQASHAHVYLTVPFVLSWSMLEAMAAGAPIVATDVAPVREAADHEAEALLCPPLDPAPVAAAVERILDDRALAARLGAAARARVIRDHDSRWVFPAKAHRLVELVRVEPRERA